MIYLKINNSVIAAKIKKLHEDLIEGAKQVSKQEYLDYKAKLEEEQKHKKREAEAIYAEKAKELLGL